jgi:mRNA interferase MazF
VNPLANASRFSVGDLVLVPAPFTDQSGTKKRPAVVVSGSGYNANRRDVVKPVFATIEQGLVLRVMGHLSAADVKTLREVVGDVIG